MKVAQVENIPANWAWMRRLLSKAMARDPDRTEDDVIEDLKAGRMSAFVVSGGSEGLVVTQTVKSTLWIVYAAGAVRQWADMRLLMIGLEHAAKTRGLRRIHILGRKGWGKILRPLGFVSKASSGGLFHMWKDI